MRWRLKRRASARLTCTPRSAPTPVVTPYTAVPVSAACTTAAWDAAIRLAQAGSSVTVPPEAMVTTCSIVIGPPVRIRGCDWSETACCDMEKELMGNYLKANTRQPLCVHKYTQK